VARSSLSVVFAGSGGSGAMTVGAISLRAAARAGHYGLMTQIFGPQVRGGESAALVQVSVEPVECQPDRYDLLIGLDWQKLDQFVTEIPVDKDSTIIADPAAGLPSEAFTKSKARVVALTMSDPSTSKLEKALRGRRKNIFAAAAIAIASGIPMAVLRQALAEVFEGKSSQSLPDSTPARRPRPRLILISDWRRDGPRRVGSSLVTKLLVRVRYAAAFASLVAIRSRQRPTSSNGWLPNYRNSGGTSGDRRR
jgi:Pyruvate/2-oxoacid:ferredoxin oxidoreductase gamma subunit